MMTTSLSLLM